LNLAGRGELICRRSANLEVGFERTKIENGWQRGNPDLIV
jgi:hypothetical protein